MDKSLKYLVGISAIIIAGCAAYFSITGLGILFAGASISVMVMAGSLEYAKLVTATYLKQKWDDIKGFNKWYLTVSVVVLMAITSAGIFGYLSNAFQQQNIKLEQVQREIDVWNNKIKFTNDQILTLQGQQKDLSTTQNTLLTKGNVNSRLIRSADNRDKQSTKLSSKINILQDSIVAYNGHINDIKNNNIELEREVGGFRFVAEAFGVELNSVVKFFIFLIVLVFDPLAIALVIAFNQLVIGEKLPKKKEDKDDNVKEVIEEESRLKLSENDLKKLEEVLFNPPPPNDNLKEAASEYNDKTIEKTLEQLENYFKNTPQEEIQKHVDEINNMDVDTQTPNLDVMLEDGLEEEFDEDWGDLTNEELIGDDEIFSNTEPNSENISQEEDYTGQFDDWKNETPEQIDIPVDEIIEVINDEPVLITEEEPLSDDTIKILDEAIEEFNEQSIQEEADEEIENNERMDVIGQNGNEGLHYENEENTSSEQDDEKKKLNEFQIQASVELTEESDSLIIEDIPPQQTQTLELVDSKEDENLYWETDDTNPNQIIYDLENNQTIIPTSEEDIIALQPSQPEKVITRNVSSRRRNNR
jgi:hypothetical protein